MAAQEIAPKLILRPMLESDLAWVCQEEARAHQFPWSTTSMQQSFVDHQCFIASRSNGDCVAYAVIMRILEEAHLLNITVAASCQEHGCGGEFLRQLMDYQRAQAVESMLLEVRPSNVAAVRLYEKTGFLPIGLRKEYYRSDEGREDALVMRCAL